MATLAKRVSEDLSWTREWEHFAEAIATGRPMLGELADAYYAWATIEAAYGSSPLFAPIRAAVQP